MKANLRCSSEIVPAFCGILVAKVPGPFMFHSPFHRTEKNHDLLFFLKGTNIQSRHQCSFACHRTSGSTVWNFWLAEFLILTIHFSARDQSPVICRTTVCRALECISTNNSSSSTSDTVVDVYNVIACCYALFYDKLVPSP